MVDDASRVCLGADGHCAEFLSHRTSRFGIAQYVQVHTLDLADVLEDEGKLIDLPNAPMWLAQEHPVVG